MAFSSGGKIPATQLKLIFLHVILRCHIDSVVIKVELTPESDIVFKVAYVLFSCFTFNSTNLIGIKVTGSIFYLFCMWLFMQVHMLVMEVFQHLFNDLNLLNLLLLSKSF